MTPGHQALTGDPDPLDQADRGDRMLTQVIRLHSALKAAPLPLELPGVGALRAGREHVIDDQVAIVRVADDVCEADDAAQRGDERLVPALRAAAPARRAWRCASMTRRNVALVRAPHTDLGAAIAPIHPSTVACFGPPSGAIVTRPPTFGQRNRTP